MSKVRLAVAGAGLIGIEHIKRIESLDTVELVAMVDPSAPAVLRAAEYDVPLFTTLSALLEADIADGVVLATPNQLHAEQARLCIDAGMPVLIEKPVTDGLESALALLEHYSARQQSADSAPPVLVGHHRAYSSNMALAAEAVRSGQLGNLVAVQGSALFYKPAQYFQEGLWRTQPGGGPILLNLIHEIGNLRQLAGEITEVFALTSNRQRGYAVEDSCALTLQFAQGAVGTFLLSDCAASPKSWEQTSGENKHYAYYPDQSCYHLAGTQGSLSVPNMQLHRYAGGTDPSWWNPFEVEQLSVPELDPLVAQIESFARVIRGEESPRVSLEDGVNNLRVVDAIVRSASTQLPVSLI